MTQERLEYIFRQVTAPRDSPLTGMHTPWTENGCIYATNARVMLVLENKDGRDGAFVPDGEKHPQGQLIYTLDEVRRKVYVCDDYYVRLDELESLGSLSGTGGLGEIGGLLIRDTEATAAARVCRLLGMEAAIIYTDRSYAVITLCDGRGITGFLLMMSCSKDCDLPRRPLACRAVEGMEDLDGAWMDSGSTLGEAYYRRCLEEDARIEEEYNKANFDVYEVTLKKTVTVCVRARSEEEAGEIAMESVADWDFDCMEVEGIEENRRYNVCDYHDRYYDKNGSHDWDEEEEDDNDNDNETNP